MDWPLVKRLALSLREYKRNAVLAPCYVMGEAVLDVFIPYLMADIIDHGIGEGSMRAIVGTGGALILAAALSLVAGVLSGRHAAIASAGLARNVRRDQFRNIQDFSFENIDRFSASSLVTRLTTDVANLQNAFQMMLRILVRSPAMLVFSLVMAFRVNAAASLAFLAAAPFLGAGLYLIVSRAHPMFEKAIRAYDRLNTVVRENLRGIRVVKSYVREEHEIEKFKAVSGEIHRTYSYAEKLISLNSPLMQFTVYALTLFLAWVGARMIVAGGMTTGQLMSLISYATQILMSLMLLSMALVMIAVSRASAERVAEVLDEKSTLRNPENPVYAVKDGSVRFERAGFRYSRDSGGLCLRDVDLDIPSGSTVGVIGGTGSGKTTLVQLIPRLYDAAEGRVLVGGLDVREYDLATLRDRVAMAPQNSQLFSGTIRENLKWGKPDASDADLARAARIARADEFIEAFPDGYDSRVEQGGANLSGGQKQRLCLARALLKNPAVLILDDSTSAVDAKNDAAIRSALGSELPGVTRFIVSQRISSIEDADRIVVMDGGRVNGFGTHAGLLETNAIYREIYESQTRNANGVAPEGGAPCPE